MGHLQENGFAIADVSNVDRATHSAIREQAGVPADSLSCHTAFVGDYVIEGHVPADVIKRLLHERPPGVIGLVVPGMPPGSPGMEGLRHTRYVVQALHSDGSLTPFEHR